MLLFKGLAGAILASLFITVGPATAGVLLHQEFERDEGGWLGVGTSASVSIVHDADHVKVGKGSMKFDYAVKKGDLNLAIFQTPDGQLAKMKSMQFWVKSDYPTTMIAAMQEKGGGRYLSAFAVNSNGWQKVELAPQDFTLSTSATDPKDPDGKLDMDQVQGIGLMDMSQMFVQAGNADLEALLGIKEGNHSLYLNDFSVSDDPLPEVVRIVPKGTVFLDNYSRPQVSWAGVGGAALSRATGKPLDTPAVQADYHQTPGRIAGWMKGLASGALVGAERMTFMLASRKPTQLLVQLEETDGGKYNTMVDVPGDSKPTKISLALDQLTPSQDSKDKNGTLDLDLVNNLVVIDLSGMLAGVDQGNTVWMGDLRAVAKAKE